jgi:2-(1,2-epoxy-1,2-dihydrophenyl)acetyl-CoA isomerase
LKLNVDSAEPVLLHSNGSVVELVLNRPSSLNAINDELAAGLQRQLDLVGRDRGCRCLVITGRGRGFCSGQALDDAGSGADLPTDVGGLVRERYIPLVTQIRGLPIPVLAAVNGVAAGAGFSLALAADLRVASDTAWFSCAFARIGLVPDSGATFFLARYLGLSKALQVALTGERIGAAEAASLGLVAHVYSADTFAHDYAVLAQHLAEGPTRAFALTKRAFNQTLDNPLAQQLELEAQLQQEASETDDFREGVASFREKRQPRFVGH